MTHPQSPYFLAALITLNFFIILAMGFMTPVWAEYVHKIGGDLRTAGNAVCIFSIIIGLLTFITAYIEYKLAQDEIILCVSQALLTVSYLGYLFIDSPMGLYLVQIALGISGAIQVPALYALYSKLIPSGKSTFYWGVWNGVYNIALGLGALSSAYVVHHFGFTIMFFLLFSLACLCLLMTIVTMYHLNSIKKQVI